MAHFAIHSARMATTVLVQCAGKTAQKSSETMVPSATSQIHTEEELVPSTSAMTVRSMACFGTLYADQTITMLAAAFAHLIVHQA